MLGTTPVSSQEFSLLHKLVPTGLFPLALQLIIDFLVSSDGKASAYNAGDPGLIPGLGRSSGEGNGTHSSTLAWKIPWTEEPGRLQSMRSQRVGHD